LSFALILFTSIFFASNRFTIPSSSDGNKNNNAFPFA
jgi:hypothetical protein